MQQSTLRDPGPETVGRARLLTQALRYDDLLQPEPQTFTLLPATKQIRIGRTEDDGPVGWRGVSELRLRDSFASVRHCSLELRGETYVLTDDGSANGTRVNGEPVRDRVLADGDLIEVGHTLLVYRVVDARLSRGLLAHKGAPPRLGPAPSHNPEIVALLDDLSRVAPSRESVLILGETGAGKEMVAEFVHRMSERKGAFRAVDCGAVPETLFESTFFGHQKGAFTGAAQSQVGEISRADRGTLFLDEVGNLGAAVQPKLLRAIETGRVTPVGGSEPTTVDVRWIAATNRELLDDAGFRQDLFRRLAAYVARLPPLRRRREDLGVLTAHLLREAGVPAASITAAAGRQLFSGSFPGNVRELKTTLRSAALLAAGAPIDLPHLPTVAERAAPSPASEPVPPRPKPTAAEIEALLRQHGGNISRTADVFGISRRQLHRWLKRDGIRVEGAEAEQLSEDDAKDD